MVCLKRSTRKAISGYPGKESFLSTFTNRFPMHTKKSTKEIDGSEKTNGGTHTWLNSLFFLLQ
jgi:hypothetical protein